MTTTMSERITPQAVRPLGYWCLIAGLLGAASGVYLAVAPAQVDAQMFSYPLAPAGFALIQVWFFVQHLGLILGLLGIGRAGALGTSRTGRISLRAAVAGMALLALTELAAIAGWGMALTDGYIAVLNVAYGVSTLLIGIGLVVAGIAVIRAHRWMGAKRYVPLLLGVWVFVPMTPALAGPFVAARLAITSWMLLFAWLGWVLIRESTPIASRSSAGGAETEPGIAGGRLAGFAHETSRSNVRSSPSSTTASPKSNSSAKS